jgi:hypothetical protein
VCVVAVAVAAFFLALYPAKRYPLPIGWDTPRYLAQTNIVAARGLSGVPSSLPPPSKTLASRAGFPVMVLSLSAVFGGSPFQLATTVPVAAVVALALAAGTLVSTTLRRADWDFAVVGVVVALSPMVVRLMAPETYTDNLLAAALFVAGFAAALAAVRDGHGVWGAILLLGAGGLAHEPFFGVALAVLLVVAVAYAPSSWRAWRAGIRPWRTPSGRLGTVVGGAAAVTAVGIFGVLRASPDTPKLSLGELRKKFHEDVPLYRFPFTVAIALVGLADLAVAGRRPPTEPADGDGRRAGRTDPAGARLLLALLLAWGLILALGLVAFAAGKTVPAHRFLAMMLPVPILGALGILAVARWARGAGRLGPVLGAVVVVVGVGAMAVLGFHDLYTVMPATRGVEWLEVHKVQEAATAANYLDAERVPASTPVIFVVDDTGPNPLSYVPEMAYIIRSALPAERIPQSWFYVGNPERFLAGKPTLRDHPATYNVNSNRFWRPLARMLAATTVQPVVLVLKDFNPLFLPVMGKHPEWLVAKQVLALQGPRPARPLAAATGPRGLRSVPRGLLVGMGTLVVLALVGLGWAIALLPRRIRPFEVFALAPAFGIAFLLFAGILVDAVGIRLSGGGGVLAVVLAAAGGAAAALLRGRARLGLLPSG